MDLRRRKIFNQCKDSTLNREDLSKKGFIDTPILDLVSIINENEYYYTTSTCSGRITIIEKPYEDAGSKVGNNFLLNSHYRVDLNHFQSVIESFTKSCQSDSSNERCLWLKYEPFIMHIQCYDLEKAKQLLNIAIASGCRNSGITFGKPDKHLLAIRSTSSMEVPLVCGERYVLSASNIRFLCEESNRRLSDNMTRLSKLQDSIKEFLCR